MFKPSQQLQHLADALRPALDLPGGAKIDRDLVEFSTGRHRVTSLLFHAVTRSGKTETAPEVLDLLQHHAQSGARKVLRQAATSHCIGLAFAGKDIGFTEFKGSRLSTLLYGQAAFRDCKDIDILLDPLRMRDALETITDLGMTRVGGNPIDPGSAMRLLSFAKEIEVFDPHHGTAIELHIRSMKEPPEDWDDAKLRNVSLDLQNPYYVLYLILHGCASRWSRLKWQADFVRLVTLVEPSVHDEVVRLIREYRCSAAVAASCEIASGLWPDAQVRPWYGEAMKNASQRHVEQLVQSYSKAIQSAGRKPARESLGRRLGITSPLPLYGNKAPSRAIAVRNRAGAWFMRAMLDR